MNCCIIVDLESTCRENNEGFVQEIIEIGAVKINELGNIIEEFDAFVKPVINPVLSDFCKELTAITQEDVDNAEEFPKVLERFKLFIGNSSYPICSWGYYDKVQFVKDCNRYSLDASWIERNHINLKTLHHKKVMKGKKRPLGMAKALKKAGIRLEGRHHRGIDDAKNIAKIFKKYLSVWELF